MTNTHWKRGIALAASLLVSGVAQAQGDRVTRIIVPFSPGGGADAAARVIAKSLQAELGETVIVENKPGAGGNLGIDQVVAADRDGRTLGMATNSVVINPLLYPAVTKFDPHKSLAPVAMLGTSPIVLLAAPRLPANTLPELLSYIRKNPGNLSYASCGNGSIHHLAGEAFKSAAKVFITHIPYRGCSVAMTDVAGGQVDLAMISLTTARPFVEGRKVKALAITAAKPSPLVPTVPPVASAGLQGYSFDGWYGLVAPAGTPEQVIRRLNLAINKALAQADVQKAYAAQSIDVDPQPAAAFGAFMAKETEVYSRIIKDRTIKGE